MFVQLKRLTLIIILLLSAVIVTAQADTVQIQTFTANVNAVSAVRLRDNSQTLTLSWDVSNRPDTVKLVFHQILPGGIPVNIEQPRESAWVESSGSGVVMPVYPGSDTDILLLMRAVEVETGITLDYQVMYLPIVPEDVYVQNYPDEPELADDSQLNVQNNDMPVLSGTLPASTKQPRVSPTPYPTASITRTPTPTTHPLNPSFARTASPIIHGFHVYNEFPTLDDTVLLAWNVENADEVWVYGTKHSPYGFPQDAYASGATGGTRMLVASLATVPGDHTVEMSARNSFTGEEVRATFVIHVMAAPLPSQSNAQILSFTITPRSGNPDDIVTLAWETIDADELRLNDQPFDGALPKGTKQVRLGDLAPSGEHWVTLEAISHQPGWAGSGFSTSVFVHD